MPPAALALSTVSGLAIAQDFDYSFDAASSIDVTTSLSLDLTGNLKGTFDAMNNPGAFGGPLVNIKGEVVNTLEYARKAGFEEIAGLKMNTAPLSRGRASLEVDCCSARR